MTSLLLRLSASADQHSTGWRIYFKLYCFLDTENVPKDSVEFAFMFEQVTHSCMHVHTHANTDKASFPD